VFYFILFLCNLLYDSVGCSYYAAPNDWMLVQTENHVEGSGYDLVLGIIAACEYRV
jgi:hypothetical protein